MVAQVHVLVHVLAHVQDVKDAEEHVVIVVVVDVQVVQAYAQDAQALVQEHVQMDAINLVVVDV